MPNSTTKPVRDVIRGSLVHEQMSDPAFRQKVIASIGKKFPITRTKDRFSEPLPNGHKSLLVNVKLPNGMEGEIQGHTPQTWQATHDMHPQYEQLKKAKQSGDTEATDALTASMKTAHDKAHSRPLQVCLLDDHAPQYLPQAKKLFNTQNAKVMGFKTPAALLSSGVKPDITLLDWDLGKGRPTGLDVLPKVKSISHKVVGFSDNLQHDKIMRDAGADDFILKTHIQGT